VAVYSQAPYLLMKKLIDSEVLIFSYFCIFVISLVSVRVIISTDAAMLNCTMTACRLSYRLQSENIRLDCLQCRPNRNKFALFNER